MSGFKAILVMANQPDRMHLIGHALTTARVDLRHCTSIDQVVETVQAFIRERRVESGHWVLGWGWGQSLFREKRMPNRGDLDRA